MKKLFIIIYSAMQLCGVANACEICGCGTGNYYIGLVPQFHHYFFGTRYQYQKLSTVLASDPSQFSKDYFKAVELWGGINITQKTQLLFIVPINFIHQVSDDGINNFSGLGDIAILVNHKFLDRISFTKKNKITQQFWAGIGVKLPSGKYAIKANDPELLVKTNLQLGSASIDYMLNSMYSCTIDKFGIKADASYKFNTINKDKFAFGNKFASSILSYYSIKKKQINLLPNIGVNFETIASNKYQSKKINLTGGSITTFCSGLEVGFKNINIGTNVQLPLMQNFANKQTNTKIKGMVHITFSF